jgi:hypothetical protein
MTINTYLFLFIIGLIVCTVWGITTNKTTPEERDEMLNDKEMWP